MKLSIVVICWNDSKVIFNCLDSIYEQTKQVTFEVVVSDNGSSDGSIPLIKSRYPRARVIENGANLGFAKGNNAGIQAALGEYVLVLNPDTIILRGALDKFLTFADQHPEAGAFGCRVLNPDGSLQTSARPEPTVRGELIAALGLRVLGRMSDRFASDLYYGWDAKTERAIDWQSGCCVLLRRELLKRLCGFDERFFYHCEETDLCHRVRETGAKILFYPGAEIIHLGGQSVGRFPIRFILETYRSRYRYFYKHYGARAVRNLRRVILLHLGLRIGVYSLLRLVKSTDVLKNRLAMYKVAFRWNAQLDPVVFVESGAEPDVGYSPLAPAPRFTPFGSAVAK